MKNRPIILASKSPRRNELLRDTGITYSIHSEDCEEIIDHKVSKEKAIEQIAYTKAKAVLNQYPQAIVIGADTMVCLHNEMLGKPKDVNDACHMLTRLSGKTHEVITAVSILCEEKELVFHETTYVTFYDLDQAMIDWYIDTQEPFDKAGAYGIQGQGKLLVKEIQGDYFNVVGLPIARVYRELIKFQKNIEK